MSSIKKPQNKHCTKHVFSLKAKSQTCFYQQPISLKFCDDSNLKTKSLNSNISGCYEGPIFNTDKNFLTSSFIMSSQKKKYVQNGSRCLSDQNKYQNLNEEKSQMLIPKPNSKHMHCNVCKEKYQDYQQHILQQKHKKKIRASTFNQHILDLETKYLRLRSSFRLKQTQTEASNVIIIDQQSVDQQKISKPRKRVKKQQKAPETLKQPKLQINTHQATRIADQSELYNKMQTAKKFYWDMIQFPQYHPQYNVTFNGMFPYYGLDMIMWYNMQNQNNGYIRQMMNHNMPIIPPHSQNQAIRSYNGVQNLFAPWAALNMNN